MKDKGRVSLTERRSRLQSAAAFFQLVLLSADGLIKQVVLKQIKMDAQRTRVPGLGSLTPANESHFDSVEMVELRSY